MQYLICNQIAKNQIHDLKTGKLIQEKENFVDGQIFYKEGDFEVTVHKENPSLFSRLIGNKEKWILDVPTSYILNGTIPKTFQKWLEQNEESGKIQNLLKIQ